MTRQLRAELFKLRSTRTTVSIAAGMVALIASAVALHAFGLNSQDVARGPRQLGIMVDVGQRLGSLFAASVGALVMTGEIRHGTIRPTFLVTPRRARVVGAKAVVSLAAGTGFGLLATATAAVASIGFLAARGMAVHVSAGDYIQLLAGGAAAAGLWAVIGLGVGAVVRAQVPAIVGLVVWMLFVEGTLEGVLPHVAEFAPGKLAVAVAGGTEGIVAAPAVGIILLALYALGAVVPGWLATTTRDFA